MSKLQAIIQRGIQQSGGDRDATVAFAMEQMERDPALLAEMQERALELIVADLVQEVMDDHTFRSDDPDAIAEEALKRLQKRRLRIVR